LSANKAIERRLDAVEVYRVDRTVDDALAEPVTSEPCRERGNFQSPGLQAGPRSAVNEVSRSAAGVEQ
jgi:hypothetical protein